MWSPESVMNSGVRSRVFAMRSMSGGTVAENSSVCRSFGMCSRMAESSRSKPIESISSLSSSTTRRTCLGSSVPRRR